MSVSADSRSKVRQAMCGLGLIVAITSIGCQHDVGGQTLPSAYYLKDDIQYFPAGPEFKLHREAAAMQAFKAEQELQNSQRK